LNELKYAGVSAALWETHAATWHSETQNWGAPRHAAVLYIDGTTKPIFTNLFSQSTHHSIRNRVMPGLDIVPVLTSNLTSAASGTTGLIEIESLLHDHLPFI